MPDDFVVVGFGKDKKRQLETTIATLISSCRDVLHGMSS